MDDFVLTKKREFTFANCEQQAADSDPEDNSGMQVRECWESFITTYQNDIGFPNHPHINFPVVTSCDHNTTRCWSQCQAIDVMTVSHKFI